jgi:hypothetical protein
MSVEDVPSFTLPNVRTVPLSTRAARSRTPNGARMPGTDDGNAAAFERGRSA